MINTQLYIAFLRGINVGGHHKVPMGELRKVMEELGYTNVSTLLNSGNVVFKAESLHEVELEESIKASLISVFDFDIPVVVLRAEDLLALNEFDPFSDVDQKKDIKYIVSFLKEDPQVDFPLPYHTEDLGFKMLCKIDKVICSAIDHSKTGTIEAMAILEKTYGKEITTRSWKTIEKILKLVNEKNGDSI